MSSHQPHVNAASTETFQTPAATQRINPWSDEDDKTLLSTYQKYRGDANLSSGCIDFDNDKIWEHVASTMSSRSAVQCLLRYMKLTSNNRVSEIDCSATAVAAVGGKRDYDDYKSPSSASTSSASSRKKSKPVDVSSDEWTEEETERLTEVMLMYQDGITTPDWDAIAKHFPGKSPVDCLTHWTDISLPDQIKGKGSWLPNEDAILREKRAVYGRKWSKIAEYLPGRTGKQCRERYINHLNPNLKRGEWTDDEEAVLIAMHEHHGNKWTLISKQLPGRSDNDVKNHFYSTINRKFDMHGKEKLVHAAIQQVYMLVDAGRLEMHVIKDWKQIPINAPAHPVKTIHPPPMVEPFRAIPHPPEHAAGVPMYNMYDPLHYSRPLPPHPHVGVFPPIFHGHHQMVPPAFAPHCDKANETAQTHPN